MEKTIIRITTVPMAFKVLLAGQIKYMNEHGFKVIMVSADGKERNDVINAEGCEHIIVPMTRKITPFSDLVSFFRLRKLIKKYKPAIVHTHTPKAGLLGMMAAKAAGVKIRIHTVAGLPLMLETGLKRKLLEFTEKLTYGLATEVRPNSKSMYNFILENKLVDPAKLLIIGNGSTNGVEAKKFSKANLQSSQLQNIQHSIKMIPGALKILCVGRMVKDKGIEELIHVFKWLQPLYNIQLILVGPFEPHLDPLSQPTMREIESNPAITHIDWSDAVEYYMGLADIFVHPSHREGFPNVILQAGAMQLPVVCSDIPGNTDIITDEKTGFVFSVKNEEALFEKMQKAITDKTASNKMAAALFEEVTSLYNRERIHEMILESYNRLLKQHGS